MPCMCTENPEVWKPQLLYTWVVNLPSLFRPCSMISPQDNPTAFLHGDGNLLCLALETVLARASFHSGVCWFYLISSPLIFQTASGFARISPVFFLLEDMVEQGYEQTDCDSLTLMGSSAPPCYSLTLPSQQNWGRSKTEGNFTVWEKNGEITQQLPS